MSTTFSSQRRGFLAGAATCCAWFAQSSLKGAELKSPIVEALPHGATIGSSSRTESLGWSDSSRLTIASEPATTIVSVDADSGESAKSSPIAKVLKLNQSDVRSRMPGVGSLALIIERSGAWQLKRLKVADHASTSDAQMRIAVAHKTPDTLRMSVRVLNPSVANSTTTNSSTVLLLDDVLVDFRGEAASTHRGWDPKIARHFSQVTRAEFEFSSQINAA